MTFFPRLPFDNQFRRYLSSYYAKPDVVRTKSAENGYEAVPTLVGMADVYIDTHGYVWNKQARPRPGWQCPAAVHAP